MFKHPRIFGTALALAFVGCILAANWVTTERGIIPVGFGLTATAGTYFAGLTFVLRDTLQDVAGRRAVVATIILGAGFSFACAAWIFEPGFLPPGVSATSIAVASAVAFGLSELADFAVYTPLRQHGYLRAALASNVVGIAVDTFLFLWISGFGFTRDVVAGQFVGKLTLTAVALFLVLCFRAGDKVGKVAAS